MMDEAFHLTPLDVRRYDFGRALRGYNPARVDQFRDQVAEEMERLTRINQDLDAKARSFHEQLRAFRERDKALNDALVSAQQLRGEVREQAEREAQLILREAQAEGERIIEGAKADVRRMEEELDNLDRSRRTYLAQMRTLIARQLSEVEASDSHVVAQAKGKPEFVFFEGPPTANGRPGIHHVFSRTVKDLFCRHRAMRGFHVARKAGWDTHGLPVEIEVEKRIETEFGLRTAKQQIEKIGVERFNEMCRESVWRYRADWEQLSERIGYWLDYSDPYITYSNDYIESVWWALATLFRRGRLYRGHKVLPYCA